MWPFKNTIEKEKKKIIKKVLRNSKKQKTTKIKSKSDESINIKAAQELIIDRIAKGDCGCYSVNVEYSREDINSGDLSNPILNENSYYFVKIEYINKEYMPESWAEKSFRLLFFVNILTIGYWIYHIIIFFKG